MKTFIAYFIKNFDDNARIKFRVQAEDEEIATENAYDELAINVLYPDDWYLNEIRLKVDKKEE